MFILTRRQCSAGALQVQLPPCGNALTACPAYCSVLCMAAVVAVVCSCMSAAVKGVALRSVSVRSVGGATAILLGTLTAAAGFSLAAAYVQLPLANARVQLQIGVLLPLSWRFRAVTDSASVTDTMCGAAYARVLCSVLAAGGNTRQ
jgi:hypothetical protein